MLGKHSKSSIKVRASFRRSKMSSSQRSASSPGFSWSTARLNRETRTPSASQHQVTPPTRIITPPKAQQQVNPSIRTSPRHNLFSTMDNQDDESIRSTDSNHPDMMLIIPCDDFCKYGVWLRKTFPHIITPTGSFFVHSNLKI